MPNDAQRGVIVALATSFDRTKSARLAQWMAEHAELRTWDGKDLALVPTVFDRLDERLCRRLVYRVRGGATRQPASRVPRRRSRLVIGIRGFEGSLRCTSTTGPG